MERARPEDIGHVYRDNWRLTGSQQLLKGVMEPQPCFANLPAFHHLIERGTDAFPLCLRDKQLGNEVEGVERVTNLSERALSYIESMDAALEGLSHHVLVTLHDPTYHESGAEAAERAADQGAYWRFFDAYMRQRAPLPPQGYTHLYARAGALWLAQAHGLDRERFAECLDCRAHRDTIERQARQSLFEIHLADPSCKSPGTIGHFSARSPGTIDHFAKVVTSSPGS